MIESPIKEDKDMLQALSKFIYECERERHAFHMNHRVNPKDLDKFFL